MVRRDELVHFEGRKILERKRWAYLGINFNIYFIFTV
jgi:hypothetical protein